MSETEFPTFVAAALTEDPPDAWKKQLKNGGVMALSIMNSLRRFVKKSDSKFDTKEFPGFSFAPFVCKFV